MRRYMVVYFVDVMTEPDNYVDSGLAGTIYMVSVWYQYMCEEFRSLFTSPIKFRI